MFRIVSVSNNLRLLINRNDALAIAGYSVISPRAPEEAPLLVGREKADAVVIGHSIPPEDRIRLIGGIRAMRPDIPIVFVYQKPEGAPEPLADVSLDVSESPAPLIDYFAARLAPRRAAAE